jgi:hypothetical protein
MNMNMLHNKIVMKRGSMSTMVTKYYKISISSYKQGGVKKQNETNSQENLMKKTQKATKTIRYAPAKYF